MSRFIKILKKSVLTLAILLMTTASAWAQLNWTGTQTIINYQLSIINSIDISHLSAGIYFVKIRTEAGEVVKKVVKE